MKAKQAMALAKSKAVIQDASLRTLGTAAIGAGLMAFQYGETLEEKALGVAVIGIGLLIYVVKDVLDREEPRK